MSGLIPFFEMTVLTGETDLNHFFIFLHITCKLKYVIV
jgi:hypothetical protein